MPDALEQVIIRQGEFIRAHTRILEQLLKHLAARNPKLLGEISQAIAEKFAEKETISSELGQQSDADVQRRVDEILSAAGHSRSGRRAT
jgi:hypothetical protein